MLACAAALCAVGGADELQLRLLPRGRPFKPTFADPREIRMALGIAADGRLNAFVGNYFSVVGWDDGESGKTAIHLGIEGAGYFTMHSAGGRFPLETADGLVGLYADASHGEWRYQLRYTHVSAHLADGLPGASSIPYSRETVIARVGWQPTPTSQVYGGLHWLSNSTPLVTPLQFQLGAYWFLPWARKTVPFVAADLKWRRESAFDPSFAFQAGIALNDPPEAYRSFRVFYAYYTGADPRGQFFQTQYTSHSLGIEMQI